MISVSIKHLIAYLNKTDKRTGLVLRRWGRTTKYEMDDNEFVGELLEAIVKDNIEGRKIGENFIKWVDDWMECFNALAKIDESSMWSCQGVKIKLGIPNFGVVELRFDVFSLLDRLNRCESVKLLE